MTSQKSVCEGGKEEDRAPGIAPEEDKELDQLLDEIMELLDKSDKATDEIKQN